MQSANPLNVLITGATTALGREVTRQLAARGHHVTGLTDGSANAAKVRQDGGIPAFVTDPFRAGEFKSLLRAAQADVALHLTPQLTNGFPRRDLAWAEATRAVSDGTAALLHAAQETGVKFLVYPSFTYVYGDLHGGWADEDTPRSRAALFRAAAQAEDAVLNSGVPACVIRAGRLYGAGEDGTAALIEMLRRGRGIVTGDPHAVTSWVHVADLAAALVLAAEQQPAGQIFNVADDTPAAPVEFVNYLAASLGMPAPGQPPSLPLRPASTDVMDTLLAASARVRSDKARQTLGWQPRYPSYRAGLDQALLVERAGK